jgi:amidase
MARIGFLLVALAARTLWAQSEFVGEWIVRTYDFGQPGYNRLVLKLDGGKLAGTIAGGPIEITVNGREILLRSERSQQRAVLAGNELDGEVTRDGRTWKWQAERVPPRPAQPRVHDFEPSEFHLYFSAAPKPVLRVFPGDTVRTWGVDAGGGDAKGVRRSLGGNPQTGPFYVEARCRETRWWSVSTNCV